jgi:isoleucyl-tRNA synthetase
MEAEVHAYWKKQQIFERSLEERPADKTYVFYDGPPFATGLPHYGHLLQSAIKDAIPRYWTMKGMRVPRRWGWDCHGLPIENLIEKQLALGSKRAIEEHGIDKFNDACRMSVSTYVKDWGTYIDRLGRWVDFDNSYKTLDNDYVESVWWVFSELHKNGYIYKGDRVSLYCPRCATPLSNFEIAMGNSYEDKEDPSVYVKFPVKGKEATYFLAWTTTPWTLPANTGLAVHPELTYVAVKLADLGETLIFAESRQSEVLKKYAPYTANGPAFEVVGHWMGKELVGERYAPLYEFLPVEGDGFRVVPGMHVAADNGTGIVHTAPGFGEEDYQMMKEQGLPLLMTVDDEGRLLEACGPFAGLKIKDADPEVIKDLEARGLMWRTETITHSVPVCWRCSTLLLYKAQPAWYVEVTKLKPMMLKAAEKINWHPEHFKNGRFGKGLETAPDWCISRTRYWGASIPVWECADCGEQTVVSSIEELAKKAKPGTLPEPMDLHRPHIDQVVLPCSCGKEQRRIKEVFDCWFESGSMPYASQHYPFENKKAFEKNFPADFIAEGQDQTRGWFYTLHVLSSALFDKPAFENVIVNGMVLAEDGKKMSKKLKNYPDPLEVMEKYGADAGESPLQAAQRETREETSSSLTNVSWLFTTLTHDDAITKNAKTYRVYVLKAQLTSDPKISEPLKVPSFKWFDLGTLPENLFGPTKIYEKQLLESIKEAN